MNAKGRIELSVEEMEMIKLALDTMKESHQKSSEECEAKGRGFDALDLLHYAQKCRALAKKIEKKKVAVNDRIAERQECPKCFGVGECWCGSMQSYGCRD